MPAFFLTAAVTRRLPVDDPRSPNRTACYSVIVCAENDEEARSRFSAWLRLPPEGAPQTETDIHLIVGAALLEQLLSETGTEPLDWAQVAQEAQAAMEAASGEEFEQGYWVDVNLISGASATLEALRQELPEDVGSGLNWAGEKQSYFLVSVLGAVAPPSEAMDAVEQAASDPRLEELKADFPELACRETTGLVRARNAAAAAWIWRRFCVNTSYAESPLRLDPWCGVLRSQEPGAPAA